MDLNNKVAEVIEASSSEFTAQCYRLDQVPPLGSLVKAQDRSCEIYAIVYNAETHSLEPGRRIIARGENMQTEDEVFRANPQLTKLLGTDFKALVIGHRQGGSIYHYLPPKPTPIHSFIYTCQAEELRTFTQSLDFLSLLVNARLLISADEVTAACLRYAGKAYPDTQAFLIKAGKELARLLGDDTSRLNSILKRLKE